jgi:hypothetical protein
MPKLRTLSGNDLLRIFAGFGFRQHSQRGTLTIVLHTEVDRGTLHAIYRQALRFIPEAELREHFYTE